MWTAPSARFVFLFIAAALVVSAVSEAQESRTHVGDETHTVRTIVIDPGHGGEDTGTVGVAGIHEKELTLATALALRDELLARDPNLNVILTREDDSYPTLEQRTHLANMVEADLFISLHYNAAGNAGAHGIETFFLAADGTAPGELVPGREDDGPAHPCSGYGVGGDLSTLIVEDLIREGAVRQSARLAEMVQESLIATTSANDREVRQGRFRVLRGARMPAIVVELGFLTNEEEGVRVLDAKYQRALIEGLVEAVGSYDDHVEALAQELRGSNDTEVAHR